MPIARVSLLGQNGAGKSTFLLLAAGNLLPDSGTVALNGIDTRELRDEEERQRHVSLIFQNMEFETEDNIGYLLDFVYDTGFLAEKDAGLIPTLISTFELEKILNKRTQEISKGELQRTILAFSILYGSRILLMDEPIFAMENYQKERAMEFLSAYSRDKSIGLYYSVHELDITEKYSDYLLLFSRENPPVLGTKEQLYTRDVIEEAYQYPFPLLKRKEAVYRALLNEASSADRG
jgi:ABC-type cobalamin/Fe3+-siderophores transport system ATPase subunit